MIDPGAISSIENQFLPRPPQHFAEQTPEEKNREHVEQRNAQRRREYRDEHPLPTRPCAVCGEPFTGRRDAVVCGERCRNRRRRDLKRRRTVKPAAVW
jgi:predicted nucleic acid-binding Zn ribbon protein